MSDDSKGISFYFDSEDDRDKAHEVITAAGVVISSSDGVQGADPDRPSFTLKRSSWPDADRVDTALDAGFERPYRRI